MRSAPWRTVGSRRTWHWCAPWRPGVPGHPGGPGGPVRSWRTWWTWWAWWPRWPGGPDGNAPPFGVKQVEPDAGQIRLRQTTPSADIARTGSFFGVYINPRFAVAGTSRISRIRRIGRIGPIRTIRNPQSAIRNRNRITAAAGKTHRWAGRPEPACPLETIVLFLTGKSGFPRQRTASSAPSRSGRTRRSCCGKK